MSIFHEIILLLFLSQVMNFYLLNPATLLYKDGGWYGIMEDCGRQGNVALVTSPASMKLTQLCKIMCLCA